MGDHVLIQADSRHIPLADGSVHMACTSPPYWGLRDYSCDGQLGLEPTPADYVAEMVAVFREVKRVLRHDGCAWVNLGDSFAGGKVGGNDGVPIEWQRPSRANKAGVAKMGPGLKPKDLIGIPWMVAFALRDDGWYLRSEVIWHKNNPMPESVADRPTKSHEQVFLLSKNERYFYDADAVRERRSDHPATLARNGHADHQAVGTDDLQGTPFGQSGKSRWHERRGEETCRNLRSVWTIPTESFAGSHFATFPRKLVESCIQAGTSGHGACPACGAPWGRIVERESVSEYRPMTTGMCKKQVLGEMARTTPQGRTCGTSTVQTLGWQPSCSCDAGDPVPCIVLDPFIGSGTTIIVAEALGRRAIGLDLSRPYLDMAARRIDRPHARTPRPGRAEHLPLFDGGEPTWTS